MAVGSAPQHPLLGDTSRLWEAAAQFQKEDAEFAAHNGRTVMGHKTGLGKTFISLLAWSLWPKAKKAFIVGSLSSMGTWRRVLREWCGVEPTFVQGSDPEWKVALSASSGVWMSTYASARIMVDANSKPGKRPSFDLLINDELHRAMRTRNQTTKAMWKIGSEYYIGASATWASRGPQDLYPVLHQIDPDRFGSYWRWVNTWCHVENGAFGREILGVKNPTLLRKLLWGRYYRGRTWPEVGAQFIPGYTGEEMFVRRPAPVEMSKVQKRLHDDLDRDMMASLDGQMVFTPTSLAKLTRLLQLAVCPQILFPEAGIGGGIQYLLDKISDGPHCVIFCPFKDAFPWITSALHADGYNPNNIYALQGGMHPDTVDATVEAWKKCKGVIMCTISYAQSFALDTTDNAYMLGYSWDPNDNLQAEGRLRRFDSILRSPCAVDYITPIGSKYELVKEVINGKVFNVQHFLAGYGKHISMDTVFGSAQGRI